MVASYLVDLHFSYCKQNLFKDENQQYIDQTNNWQSFLVLYKNNRITKVKARQVASG